MQKVSNGVPAETVQLKSTSTTPGQEFFIVNTDTLLRAGETYQIQLLYTGAIGAENKGFYRSSYVQDGVTKYVGGFYVRQLDKNVLGVPSHDHCGSSPISPALFHLLNFLF